MTNLIAKDRIIFPLDLPTKTEALEYVRMLKDSVGVFKVGLELFIAEGPVAVAEIKQAAPGVKIFLDMKLHDIPETVRRAIKSASGLGVDFITVHADDGQGLLDAAMIEAGDIKILCITVLTSQSKESLADMGLRDDLADPSQLVMHRARIAKDAGASGVVCSGLEVKRIKDEFGDALITVTPGIRLADNTVKDDDQKRVVTPYDAVRDGADYLVIGRPIRDAEDPAAAAVIVAKEIQRAESDCLRQGSC
jgi:orotidine-5'-phosphate decarboxylase